MPTMDIRTRSVKAVEKDYGGAYPVNISKNLPNNRKISAFIKQNIYYSF